MNSTEYK